MAEAEAAEVEEVEEEVSEETNWRDSITDEDGKKFAESSTDLNHLVGRAMDMRQKLSTAISKPGYDASEDDVKAYHKALGVPESYTFEVPDGVEQTEDDTALQGAASELFGKFNLTQEQASGMSEFWTDAQNKTTEGQMAADKTFADAEESKMRAEWGADYSVNRGLADSAATTLFGTDIEAVRNMESKDGRYVLDDARFVRMLAKYGREMAEPSGIGAPMTETARESLQTQIYEVEAEMEKADQQMDHTKKRELYKKQTALYDKMHGTQNIVGADGRTI